MLRLTLNGIRTDKHIGPRTSTLVYFHNMGADLLSTIAMMHPSPIAVYRSILPVVLYRSGIFATRNGLSEVIDDIKNNAAWSTYAGCNCGCSPGFLIQHPSINGIFDIYVHTVPSDGNCEFILSEGDMTLIPAQYNQMRPYSAGRITKIENGIATVAVDKKYWTADDSPHTINMPLNLCKPEYEPFF